MLCPFCQEEIQDQAIKCKHCGEFLKDRPRYREDSEVMSRPTDGLRDQPYMKKAPPGTTVFVLGLLGLLVCGICGIIAWIQGNEYMSKCRAMQVQPDGLAVAGRVMGMISVGLMVLGTLFVAIAIAVDGL